MKKKKPIKKVVEKKQAKEKDQELIDNALKEMDDIVKQ